MNRAVKILLISVTVLLVIVLGLLAAGVFMVQRPFPTTDGTTTLPGLTNEVTIYRDKYGVAHIYANNETDLFFAQGYTHAQDRFWQMEFQRHVAQGRLSEIAGASTVDIDTYIRTFGWNRIAADTIAYYEKESPEFMAVLEAYSAGVNAYLTHHKGDPSLHFTILGAVNEPWEIEPWKPIDSVGWGVVMADNLASNWDEEIEYVAMMQELGDDAEALLPLYPYDNRPVVVPSAEMTQNVPDSPVAIDWNLVSTNLIGTPPDDLGLGRGPFIGSNNWVISGEHTASGMPMLANDPHLGIQMPAIWYENGLHSDGFNVAGYSFVGVPGVIIGHNEHIAWGVTTSRPDVQDLYIEKLNPDNPNQYEFRGEWRDLLTFTEVIKVNGGEDVVLEVKATHHGPIITDVGVDEETPAELQRPLAARWAAAEPSRILQSVIMLNRAQNYEDFYEAIRYWDIPSQSMVYAGDDGNIAYIMSGLVPIRPHNAGSRPMPGWTGEYEWQGWIPYEELPQLLNPPRGYIVTANHAVTDAGYPYYLNLFYADGDRAQRITDLLTAVIDSGGKLTYEDFARIQFDSYSLSAETYIPLFAQIQSDDPDVQAAVAAMQAWDLQERRDSVGAALWEITFMHIGQNLFSDDVSEGRISNISDNGTLLRLAGEPNAVWWDDKTTTAVESQADILERSVQDTLAWFAANKGGQMADWTWGSIHTATFADPVLGASGVAPIEAIFNRGPFPADGGRSTVNANSWGWGDPAAIRGHVSMRMIVDTAVPDGAWQVIPTGQSGHPYHTHYNDQVELWLNGEYHAMPLSRDQVEALAEEVLVLRP